MNIVLQSIEILGYRMDSLKEKLSETKCKFQIMIGMYEHAKFELKAASMDGEASTKEFLNACHKCESAEAYLNDCIASSDEATIDRAHQEYYVMVKLKKAALKTLSDANKAIANAEKTLNEAQLDYEDSAYDVKTLEKEYDLVKEHFTKSEETFHHFQNNGLDLFTGGE